MELRSAFIWLKGLPFSMLQTLAVVVLSSKTTAHALHLENDSYFGGCPQSLPMLDFEEQCNFVDGGTADAKIGCPVPGPPADVKSPVESQLPGERRFWRITLSWTPPTENTGAVLGYRVNISCLTENKKDVIHFQTIDLATKNKTFVMLNTKVTNDHWAPNGLTSTKAIMPQKKRHCLIKVTSLPIRSDAQQSKEVAYQLSSCRDLECPTQPISIFSGCLADGFAQKRQLCTCVLQAPSNVTAMYHTNGTISVRWNRIDDQHMTVVQYGISCTAMNTSVKPSCFTNDEDVIVPANTSQVLLTAVQVSKGYTYSFVVWGRSRDNEDISGSFITGDFSRPCYLTVHSDIAKSKKKQRYYYQAILGAVTGTLLILVTSTVYCVRKRGRKVRQNGYQSLELTTIADNTDIYRCLQEQKRHLLNSLDHKAVLDFYRTRKLVPRAVLRKYKALSCQRTVSESRRKFFELLLSRPVAEYDIFLQALDQTGQEALARRLRHSSTGAEIGQGSPAPADHTATAHVISNSMQVPTQSSVQVYISYSRWPVSMQETARHFAVTLRHHGMNAIIDQFHSLECSDSPVEWVVENMKEAKFIIVILSDLYPLCLPKEDRIPAIHHISELRLSAVEADILQGEILEGRKNFVLPVCVNKCPSMLSIPEVFKHRTIYYLDEQFSNHDWQKLVYRLFEVEMFSDGSFT